MTEKDNIIVQQAARIKELEISMNELAKSCLNVIKYFAEKKV